MNGQGACHDHDIPPQPSHTYSCLLTVQTPPEQSLTKPEPTPGLPDLSTASPNPSAAFPEGCCTDVCLVSIPEAVNTIPEHIWPFLTNPKHFESHRPTPSLHAHLWTRRLSIHNCDWAKPEHLAIFPIESYSFLPYLLLFRLSLPLSCSSCHSFLRQPCIHLVITIPSRTLTHPVITTYNYTQTTPSRSLSLVLLPSISSLCTLCIPQSEYHLWYSSLWSDPVHVPSLTRPQLAHLWPSSSSTTLMLPSTSSCLRQGLAHVTDTGRCPKPCLNPIEVVRLGQLFFCCSRSGTSPSSQACSVLFPVLQLSCAAVCAATKLLVCCSQDLSNLRTPPVLRPNRRGEPVVTVHWNGVASM